MKHPEGSLTSGIDGSRLLGKFLYVSLCSTFLYFSWTLRCGDRGLPAATQDKLPKLLWESKEYLECRANSLGKRTLSNENVYIMRPLWIWWCWIRGSGLGATLCNTESCTRCTWCVFSCISRYVFFYMHVFSCNTWYVLSHTLSHGVSPHTLGTWCVFGKTSLISFCGFVTTRAEAVLLDWNLRLKIIMNCFPHFQLFIIKTQHTMDICLGPITC